MHIKGLAEQVAVDLLADLVSELCLLAGALQLPRIP